MAKSKDSSVKLVLGCGPLPLHPMHRRWVDETWILTDLYPKDSSIKKLDARFLPYPNETVQSIYASHVLEHISFSQTQATLMEWYRALTPGGRLIVNVPDFEWACERFLENYRHGKPTGSRHFRHYTDFWQIFFGNHQHEGEYHKSGFTQKSLHELLKQARFKNIKIDQVYDAHEIMVLIAEAIK